MIIRKILLVFVGILAVSGATLLTWKWVDNRESKIKKRKAQSEKIMIRDSIIQPEQLAGKWKVSDGFFTFNINGNMQIREYNGSLSEGKWEIEEGVLFTQIGYRNTGYFIYNCSNDKFVFQKTATKEIDTAFRIK